MKVLILNGSPHDNGSPDNAINISMSTFKKLNADFDLGKDYIYSLNTNKLPAKDDKNINEQINKAIKHILN